MSGQRGFFDLDERYAALSAAGDPLQRLTSVIDFEVFRPVLDAALARSGGEGRSAALRRGSDVQDPGAAGAV